MVAIHGGNSVGLVQYEIGNAPESKNWLRLSSGARYTSSHQRNSSIAKWSKEKGGSVFVLGQDSPVLVTAAVARLGLGQGSLVLATEIMAQFLMQHWRGKAPCKERGLRLCS